MIEIGFGTWSWGNKILWDYKSENDQILEETFNAAIKGGIRLIDTADSYGIGKLNGRSEYLLGKFISNLSSNERAKLIIASKLAPYPWRMGKEGFNKAFKESIKRLNGNLDLVQLHWSTYRYAPWQEKDLITNLGELSIDGSVKDVGISNMGPKRLKWAYKLLEERGVKIKSIQIQLSLLSPLDKKKEEIKYLCEELGIKMIAYSPLALGILTIDHTKMPPISSVLRNRLFKRILPKTIELRKGIQEVAKDNNVSAAQVAINWCRSIGAIPIPGIRTPKQAKDTSDALKWNLSKNEKVFLTNLSKDCQARMPVNPFQSD